MHSRGVAVRHLRQAHAVRAITGCTEASRTRASMSAEVFSHPSLQHHTVWPVIGIVALGNPGKRERGKNGKEYFHDLCIKNPARLNIYSSIFLITPPERINAPTWSYIFRTPPKFARSAPRLSFPSGTGQKAPGGPCTFQASYGFRVSQFLYGLESHIRNAPGHDCDGGDPSA